MGLLIGSTASLPYPPDFTHFDSSVSVRGQDGHGIFLCRGRVSGESVCLGVLVCWGYCNKVSQMSNRATEVYILKFWRLEV